MAGEFVVDREMRRRMREQFQQAQRARMEVTEIRARIVEDVAQSRELMGHADFVLMLPYVYRSLR